ncbi:MAG: hypothetical protein EOO24_62130, partial [Comamonadaceae bacterium]
MSSLPPSPPPELPQALPVATTVPGPFPPRSSALSRAVLLVLALLASAGLLSSVMLWQRLSSIQEQLARQTTDSSANAVEARTLARQAQEIARDAAARQAVLETRLSEVALQRSQVEDLIQSLSRSRDENLLVDIDSALRLAQQQTQLTGSAEPLLAELRTSEQRLARAAQPRLARLRASIARDIERIRSTSVTDVPALLARLDDVVRQVVDLPVANAVPARALNEPVRKATTQGGMWWERARDTLLEEARGLVRVSRIDQPDAVLLAPEQATFLRENLKLKLLNVRLSLLARQTDTARADLATAIAALNKYFD